MQNYTQVVSRYLLFHVRVADAVRFYGDSTKRIAAWGLHDHGVRVFWFAFYVI